MTWIEHTVVSAFQAKSIKCQGETNIENHGIPRVGKIHARLEGERVMLQDPAAYPTSYHVL